MSPALTFFIGLVLLVLFGWYFATETARILGGAGGALLPEQGAELLAASATVEVAV